MRRLTAFVVAAGVALPLCAGCGVPASSGFSAVRPGVIPSRLLAPESPGVAVEQSPGRNVTVYLVDARGRLAAVKRVVHGTNLPALALRSLLRPQPAAEAASGVSSDIPEQTRLISLDVTGTTAKVDLTAQFGALGGSRQVAAVGQIVLTLTAFPYIRSVVFAIDERVIAVPDSTGSLSSDPHSRSDFADLTAPRS